MFPLASYLLDTVFSILLVLLSNIFSFRGLIHMAFKCVHPLIISHNLFKYSVYSCVARVLLFLPCNCQKMKLSWFVYDLEGSISLKKQIHYVFFTETVELFQWSVSLLLIVFFCLSHIYSVKSANLLCTSLQYLCVPRNRCKLLNLVTCQYGLWICIFCWHHHL